MSHRPMAKGSAKIEHHGTKEEFTIAPSELIWEMVSKFGQQSEIYYEGKVDHPALGSLAWRVWEYPPEARNSRETDVGKHTLIQDFEFGFELEEQPKS